MAARPVARRASELRNLMALTILRSYLAELEVKFGDQQTGVILHREQLRHLIDAEAWWSWPFIEPASSPHSRRSAPTGAQRCCSANSRTD